MITLATGEVYVAVDLVHFCVIMSYVVSPIAGAWVGVERGRVAVGLVLGFCLGPIGVLVTAVLGRSVAREVARQRAIEQATQRIRELPIPAELQCEAYWEKALTESLRNPRVSRQGPEQA